LRTGRLLRVRFGGASADAFPPHRCEPHGPNNRERSQPRCETKRRQANAALHVIQLVDRLRIVSILRDQPDAWIARRQTVHQVGPFQLRSGPALHKRRAGVSGETDQDGCRWRREGAYGRHAAHPTRLLSSAHHPNRYYSREPGFLRGVLRPVALIYRAKYENEKEAIDLTNDSPYGLGGSVITKDVERGKRIARQIEAGMVFINQATWTAPDLPFGGLSLRVRVNSLTVCPHRV
jgi:hypothetical protein